MTWQTSSKTASTTDAPPASGLVGTWKLRSRIDLTAASERRPESTLGEDPIAIVFSDAAGNFAAQFMKGDRSAPISAALPGATNNTRNSSLPLFCCLL